MEVFKERFGIYQQSDKQYAGTKGWIVAIATAGAIIGCLCCVWLTQRLGRIRTMQLFTFVYIGGCLGQAFSGGNLVALYITRIISGAGIGATTVIPSIYITEVDISHQRVTEFTLSDKVMHRLPPNRSGVF